MHLSGCQTRLYTSYRKLRRLMLEQGLAVSYTKQWSDDFHFFHFLYSSAELGSSSDPCSITYHGASPASDPETRIIQSTIEELRGKLVLFLTYHTMGELYLFPFGLRDEQLNCRRSPDHEDIVSSTFAYNHASLTIQKSSQIETSTF